MLGKLLALAGVTAGALVGVATPAAAADCQQWGSVCLITDEITIPVGTPAVGPAGAGPFVVPGPRLCNTGTGECTGTYVVLPGAYVGAGGSTMSSVTIPSLGFEIGPNNEITVYYGVPVLDPSSTGLPVVTVVATIPLLPVVTDDTRCAAVTPIEGGPVWIGGSSCAAVVKVTI